MASQRREQADCGQRAADGLLWRRLRGGDVHVRRGALGRCRRHDHGLRVDVRGWSDAIPASGSSTATHIYRTGTFTVQFVVTDNGGARATATTTVQTVNNAPVPSFVRSGLCSLHLRRVRLRGSGREGAARISWNFGDGYGGYGTAIQEHTYTSPGTYRIVLTVADDVGQHATSTARSRSSLVRCTSAISTAPARRARSRRRSST